MGLASGIVLILLIRGISVYYINIEERRKNQVASIKYGSNIDLLNTSRVVNVPNPIAPTDVVNKAYVDESIQTTPHIFATNIGNGSDTSYTVTHNLGTKDVIISVYDNEAPFAEIEVVAEHTTTDTITLQFNSVPSTSQYRVVIFG